MQRTVQEGERFKEGIEEEQGLKMGQDGSEATQADLHLVKPTRLYRTLLLGVLEDMKREGLTVEGNLSRTG